MKVFANFEKTQLSHLLQIRGGDGCDTNCKSGNADVATCQTNGADDETYVTVDSCQ